MKRPALPLLCAGVYAAQRPMLDCATCQHHANPIPPRGYWMAPPDFDDKCPEKKDKAK